MKENQENKTIPAFHRNDFRKWLKDNHQKEKKVSVLLHKRHTGKPAPTHRELMEEAICFGWIDTTIKRVDENTYLRHFARRNEKSKWSDNTLRYAKELLEKGMMAEEGMRFYNLGKQRPTHDAGIPKNPDMPEELKKALNKNKTAKKNFEKFPPSAKRTTYRWILHAKLPETRMKRITITINKAKEGKKVM